MTILVLLGSALVAMIQGMYFDGSPISVAFIMAMLFTTVFGVASLYNLAYAYIGEDYEVLAKLDDIENAEGELNPEEFDDALRTSIIDATDSNAEMNQTRQAFLGWGNQFMLMAVGFTAITGVFYVFAQAAKN